MNNKKDDLTPPQQEMREQAEEMFAAAKPALEEVLTPVVDGAMHKLHVHQIELEMQNEGLRQTQIALEKAKTHYIDLYDFAPVGYLTLNTDGIIQELNLTAAKLLGKERNKIIQQRFIKFIPDDYKDIWHRHFQQAVEHCEEQGCELPFSNEPGTISYYHLNCQCMECEKSPKLMRVTLTDVTERKNQEEILRIAGVAFETQEGMCITDHNNVIQRVNRSFTQITGYSADEVVGCDPNFLRSELNDKALYDVVGALIKQFGFWEGELLGKHKNGETFPIWLMITAVKDQQGEITHYVAAINDITERKQAEALQRERDDRDRLRLFIEHVPAAIAMFDEEMRYLAVSNRWKHDFGLSGDIIGRSNYELFPEIPERWKQIHRRALAGETFGAREDCFIRADGSIQWLNWEIVPWHKTSGELGGILIMTEEITESKRVEQLRIAAAAFEIQDCIVIADANKKILRVNKAFSSVTGYSVEEAANLSFFNAKRHDTDYFRDIWANIVHDGYWRGELWENRKNGEPYLMAINITAVTDNQGDITHYVADFIDITGRKHDEEQLRIAAAAFDTQESILVTDMNRIILSVNKAFTRITGYSADEAIGKTPTLVRSGLHDKDFYDHVLGTVAREGYWHGEIWNKRKNGEIFPVLQTITRVTDENGQLTHYVGAMVDISAQKQAEKVLLDARKRLESQVATTQEELDRIKTETAEINGALNVLLRQRETDKSDARVALTDEVEATVLPLLKKLKAVSAGRLQTIRLIKLIEDNLELLVKSYGRAGNLSSTYQKLTPIETQVAAMIRQGQPTKVIAAGLNIAPGTVSIHRKHIRKKLGLDRKKDNLHSYLIALTE